MSDTTRYCPSAFADLAVAYPAAVTVYRLVKFEKAHLRRKAKWGSLSKG